MNVSAQVSVYPLRQKSLSPAIEEATSVFRRHGLDVQPGVMSTLVIGEENELFAGLKEAFRNTASKGDVVMTITLSNACSMSQEEPPAS